MAGRSSRGNLLKRLKFFDFVIIIVVLLAGLILYRLTKQETRWINVTTIAYSTVFQTASLKAGDYEVDSSGKKIAIVNNFSTSDIPAVPSSPFFNKVVVLNVKMLVNSSSRSDQIQYKNQPLAVGSPVDFDFNSATLRTYVSKIGNKAIKRDVQSKTLTVIAYNQWPWLADKINAGDFSVDATGKKTIEVLSKEVNPTQVVNTSNTGEVMELFGSSKVDITLKIRTSLERINNEYIFQGYTAVLIGRPISFSIKNTQINNALVTNIE